MCRIDSWARLSGGRPGVAGRGRHSDARGSRVASILDGKAIKLTQRQSRNRDTHLSLSCTKLSLNCLENRWERGTRFCCVDTWYVYFKEVRKVCRDSFKMQCQFTTTCVDELLDENLGV